jgi:hypothetical protein
MPKKLTFGSRKRKQGFLTDRVSYLTGSREARKVS